MVWASDAADRHALAGVSGALLLLMFTRHEIAKKRWAAVQRKRALPKRYASAQSSLARSHQRCK